MPALFSAGGPKRTKWPVSNGSPKWRMGIRPPAGPDMKIAPSGVPLVVPASAVRNATCPWSLSAAVRSGRSTALGSAFGSSVVAMSSTPSTVGCRERATAVSLPVAALYTNTPAGVGSDGSSGTVASFTSARKATSPLAFTAGRPKNCRNVPPPGALCPLLATVTVATGGVSCRAMIASLALPPAITPRKAIQPLPAALGHPEKPGPANTPPPGAGSPAAAIFTLDAAVARGGTPASSATSASARQAKPRGHGGSAGSMFVETA